MKQEWNQTALDEVMSILSETHEVENLAIYQPIGHPEILKVKTSSTGTHDLRKLIEHNMSVTMFAEDWKIEMWICKH